MCYDESLKFNTRSVLMKKTILRKYAQLIAKAGVNVQKGQEVFIYADSPSDAS